MLTSFQGDDVPSKKIVKMAFSLIGVEELGKTYYIQARGVPFASISSLLATAIVAGDMTRGS